MERSRRLKRIGVDLDFIARLFFSTQAGEDRQRISVEEALPDGAAYQGCYIELSSNSLWLVYSHPDWPEVPVNELMPVLYPLYRYTAGKG